uniref:Putative secreted protein n=1 Tax=Anopheles darlingi TaxID=43151 RepID=A0A2M4D509_ANODA
MTIVKMLSCLFLGLSGEALRLFFSCLATSISSNTPVNRCVINVGSSSLTAWDRLEHLERACFFIRKTKIYYSLTGDRRHPKCWMGSYLRKLRSVRPASSRFHLCLESHPGESGGGSDNSPISH